MKGKVRTSHQGRGVLENAGGGKVFFIVKLFLFQNEVVALLGLV